MFGDGSDVFKVLLLFCVVFWFASEMLLFIVDLSHFFVMVYGRGQVVVKVIMVAG